MERGLVITGKVYHITGRKVKQNGKKEMEYPQKPVYDKYIRQDSAEAMNGGAETRQR